MKVIEIVQELMAANDKNFVKGLYKEFLEQTPDAVILNYYSKYLKSGGRREEILKSLVLSYDFELSFLKEKSLLDLLQYLVKEDGYEFIKDVYKEIFSKNLSVTKMQKKLNAIKLGKSKEKVIIDSLLSDRFLNKISNMNDNQSMTEIQKIVCHIFSLDNNVFINELFSQFLKRKPADIEIKECTGASKEVIYKAVLNSEDFAKALNAGCGKSCLEIFQELKEKDYELFVKYVYVQCLGREPDPEGSKHHVRLLKSGTSKLDILRIVLTSNEANELYNKKIQANDSEPVWKNLWDSVEVSRDFRAYVQSLLVKNKLPYETNIIVKTGGLGDFLQMTPVAKALKEKYPTMPVVVVVGYYSSLFDEHPYIDLAIECGGKGLHDVVKSLIGLTENVFDARYVSRAYGTHEVTEYFKKNKWYYDFFPNSGTRVEDLNMNVCDVMLHSLGLEKYATSDDVLVTPEKVKVKIPGDYVIVCDTAGSGPGQMKRWTVEEWDGLIRWLVGKNIIPVQLGQEEDVLTHPFVMDLRGKTTPRQAAGYLKDAIAYIGLEGGIFHLAKAVDTPAFVVFASTSEVCFAYSDTKVMSKRQCHPCWWTDTWLQARCLRNCKQCLNLPSWQEVAQEVSKLLR